MGWNMKKGIKILKSMMALTMITAMFSMAMMTSITADAAKKSGSSDAVYAVGDDIAFGFLDGQIISWTILTYDDTTKTAFITTKQPLNSKSITAYRAAISKMYTNSGTVAGYVRWSENYWRGWLNKTFYKECFNDTERAMIKKTTLTEQAAKNSILNYYHDKSMDANYVHGQPKNSLNMAIYNTQTTTADYIFFLSSDEYTAHKDTMKNETLLQFPLRTNAYDDPVPGLFGNDTDKLIYRMYYYAGDSIRPAMYVKLGDVSTEENADSSSTSTTKTDSNTTKSTTTKSTTTTSTNNTASTTSTTSTASTTSTKKATSSKKYANNGTNTGDITLPDDANYSMKVGATAQVAINLEYLNSTDKQYNVTYTSSNADVVVVDSNGLITATGKGSASVTVRMTKSNGKIYTMSCRIDVT